MADDPVITRLDRRLDRIDESLKTIEGHIRRGEVSSERNNEYIKGNREFMRVLTLRQERVFMPLIERLNEGTRELREHRRQWREETRAQRREFVEESRAQRAALFRILDRLDEGGATSGA